jgi:hypothetical protein
MKEESNQMIQRTNWTTQGIMIIEKYVILNELRKLPKVHA